MPFPRRCLAVALLGALCGLAVAASVQGQADVVQLGQAAPPTIQASTGALAGTLLIYSWLTYSSTTADLTPGKPAVHDVSSTGDSVCS